MSESNKGDERAKAELGQGGGEEITARVCPF